MQDTPVAIFAYNRPNHLQKTLDALSRCRHIEECQIYIYCDGVKKIEDQDMVIETRDVAHEWAIQHQAIVIEREKNFGCDPSIVAGVSELCDKYGKVIVIEDDVYVSPGFISFHLEALNHYRNDSKVYQITGIVFSKNPLTRLDGVFMPVMHSYGWSTWKRVWDQFRFDPENALKDLADRKFRRRFDHKDTYPYCEMLEQDILQKENKWDIWFYYWITKENGLVLYPKRSIVYNTGFDSSGIHCGNIDINPYKIEELEDFDSRNLLILPSKIRTNHYAYFLQRRGMWRSILRGAGIKINLRKKIGYLLRELNLYYFFKNLFV